MRLYKTILAICGIICATSSGDANAASIIQNGDFEAGDYTGWTVVSGTAFGSTPADERTFAAIDAWEGEFYNNSRAAAGESAVGVIRSDVFTLNSPITFLLSGWSRWGGGTPPTHNYVRLCLAADDSELDRVWALNANRLAEYFLSAPAAIGEEVYIEIVDDGSDTGYAWLAVDFFVQAADRRPEGDFETGTFTDWNVISGTAWGTAPVTTTENPHVSDWQVEHFADTFHSGEGAVGVLRSNTFALSSPIQFRIAGYNHWPSIEAEFDHNYVTLNLAADGTELDRAWAPGQNQFKPAVLASYDHLGEEVYIEVVDDGSNTAYAWMSVDAFDIDGTAFSHDNQAGSWIATDALERSLPLNAEVGDPRDDRYVGIFYFLWHGTHHGPTAGVWDITEIQAEHPYTGNGSYSSVEAYLDLLEGYYGPPAETHWWGKPIFEYYQGMDTYVLRKHAQMLGDAGVDTLILDATNGWPYIEKVKRTMSVLQQLRNEGCRVPQITFLLRESTDAPAGSVVDDMYEAIYEPGLFPDLWFRWHGKPLILVFDSDDNGISLPAGYEEFFTIRESWAFSDGHPTGNTWWDTGQHKWPWIDDYPQDWGWDENSSEPEAMAVSLGQHVHTNIGKSYQYLGGGQPAYGSAPTSQGLYLTEQTIRPLAIDPEFVFLTGWNEWTAGRWIKGELNHPNPATQIGITIYNGDSAFIDAWDSEYNRDAEPSANGVGGDCFYYQMIDFIRRYKGAPAAMDPDTPQAIEIDGDFSDWAGVSVEFRDQVRDEARRNDFPGYGDWATDGHYYGPYTNLTGRNDIVLSRVTYDSQFVHFYAQTREPLTDSGDANWMTLYLDVDGDHTTGWEGYDYVVNRSIVEPGVTRLEASQGNAWDWAVVGNIRYGTSGNEVEVAVPRAWVGLESLPLSVDFKWTDNIAAAGEVMTFTTDGDAAPNDRYNYRYENSAAAPAAIQDAAVDCFWALYE